MTPPGRVATPPDIRILQRVLIGDGCWIYQGHLDIGGYGVVTVGSRLTDDRRPRKAHRVLYESLRGPIPAGLDLDHLCRARACVNPWHMEPVTRAVNLHRGTTIPAANAAKTHCLHGHPYSPENTGIDKATGARICCACRAAQQRARRARRAAL